MALQFDTYEHLKDAIGDTLTRPDLVTDGTVAGFITLAEAQLKRELRRAVTKATFTFSSGANSKALPATVAELRSIAPAASVDRPKGGAALIKLTWEDFVEKRARLDQTGVPRYYTVFDQTVYVCPAPSDSYLDFDITSFDAYISVATDTALLLEAPDILYYGALVHSAPYLEHDERLPVWVTAFTDAIAALNLKREKEEFGMPLARSRLPARFG